MAQVRLLRLQTNPVQRGEGKEREGKKEGRKQALEFDRIGVQFQLFTCLLNLGKFLILSESAAPG
jgi:hypothetical protein